MAVLENFTNISHLGFKMLFFLFFWGGGGGGEGCMFWICTR